MSNHNCGQVLPSASALRHLHRPKPAKSVRVQPYEALEDENRNRFIDQTLDRISMRIQMSLKCSHFLFELIVPDSLRQTRISLHEPSDAIAPANSFAAVSINKVDLGPSNVSYLHLLLMLGVVLPRTGNLSNRSDQQTKNTDFVRPKMASAVLYIMSFPPISNCWFFGITSSLGL
jgi:hypothetical protein